MLTQGLWRVTVHQVQLGGTEDVEEKAKQGWGIRAFERVIIFYQPSCFCFHSPGIPDCTSCQQVPCHHPHSENKVIFFCLCWLTGFLPAIEPWKTIIFSVFLMRKLKFKEPSKSPRALQLEHGWVRIQAPCTMFRYCCNYSRSCGFPKWRLMWLQTILKNRYIVSGLGMEHSCDWCSLLWCCNACVHWACCLGCISSPAGQDC